MERRVLWNRWVAVVFSLPAIGYLAFLSQFWLGEPSGVVAAVLEGLFLFALPLLTVYSAILDVLPAVSQAVGTAGFFPFAYAFAAVSVAAVRRLHRVVTGN
jgi:hypothetical protein